LFPSVLFKLLHRKSNLVRAGNSRIPLPASFGITI
jgi:hypothetical protein